MKKHQTKEQIEQVEEVKEEVAGEAETPVEVEEVDGIEKDK
jgi:hypothetical protein